MSAAGPVTAGDAIAEAEAALARRDLTRARGAYERALTGGAHGQSEIRALGGLAWTLLSLGEAEASLARATEALEKQMALAAGSDAALAILLGLQGNALMALDRADAALLAYEDELRLDRKIGAPAAALADVLNRLGEAAGRLGRFDLAEDWQREAVGRLREAAAPPAELARALASLGTSLFRNEHEQEAEAVLREALSLDPELLLAAENLIHVLYKLDRRTEARVLAEQKYRRQSFVVHPPPPGAIGTLLLLWSFDGTVPHHYLLAGAPFGRIDWHIEFADPAHERDLPPYDIVLNLIGDADPGEAALRAAAGFRDRIGKPVLNDPDKVARTRRSDMTGLFGDVADLVIPRVARLTGGRALPDDFAYPVLLREAGTHGGESVAKIDDAAAFQAALDGSAEGAALYLTQFVDYASADGFFRKYRAIFIRGEPYPYHLAISPHWLVHYFSAEMPEHDWKLEEELAYLRDMPAAIGARAMAALRAIGAHTGLDYCGIDFSILPDGRVLLFECNATMLVHPERGGDERLLRKNPFIERIFRAFHQVLLDARPATASA